MNQEDLVEDNETYQSIEENESSEDEVHDNFLS